MKTLECPDCRQVMHRVEEATPKSAQIGINQLAQHCAYKHVVPAFEAMLAGVATMGLTMTETMEYTGISCLGCGETQDHDTGLYVRRNGRTIQCCSPRCQEKCA